MQTFCALLSAACAGASGMAFHVLALSSAGLLLGYGRSTAFGLAAFLAAWAAGAGAAGRERARIAPALVLAGIAACTLQPLAIAGLHTERAAFGSAVIAGGFALACIALPAFVQGLFLPWLARSGARVDRLVVVNLAGAVFGAYVVAEAGTAHFGRVPAALAAGGLALVAGIAGARAGASQDRGRADGAEAPPGDAARVASAGIANGGTRAPSEARSEVPALADANTSTGPGPHQRSQAGAHASAHARHRDSAGTNAAALAASAPGPRALVALVALCTGALVAHEWIGLRLSALWLGGMQPALVAVTCAALGALAFGALVVPSVVPRDGRGAAWVVALAALATAWPFAAPAAMRWFAAGLGSDLSALEDLHPFARALVLVGPPLVPLGALVPVLHRALGGESGARLARIFWPEALGALVAIPLVHELVVPRFGLSGALVACTAALLLAAALIARLSVAAFVVACVGSIGVGVLAWRLPAPALASPPLSNPALRVLSFEEDRDFAVAVVDDGVLGERTLLTDGFRAAGTGRDYRYMQALGHLPLLLHPSPDRVAVLALGTGTTVGAVALHDDVERIDVLEISRAVVAAAPYFEAKNHGALREGLPGLERDDDGAARVVVRLGDGRATLAASAGAYDVITMEPLLPDSPFAVYLYTSEFYAIARRALKPGGLVCQWVPPHALEPRTFEAVVRAFSSSFAWSSSWLFGTQLVLVGADAEPALDPSRFATDSAPLAEELAALGLGSARDAVARCVGAARGFERDEPTRELRDADPWIVHVERRRGAVLLADLPANLAWISERGGALPERWRSIAGVERAFEGGAAVRLARYAHARDEARVRGAAVEATSSGASGELALREALVRARELLGEDRELDELASEIAFLEDVRAGVALLSARDDRAALEPLRRAVLARPERADVHLYAAIALERVGDPNAGKALRRALESCPRLLETPAGRTAQRLGLSAATVARALDPR